MNYNAPTGFLCYNNKDLVTDGYIYPTLVKERSPSDVRDAELENPDYGTSFTVNRDESTGEILSVEERRKQLPAEKIKMEIAFSKTMENARHNPVSPDKLAGLGGIGGGAIFTAGSALLPLSRGGITSGNTEFTYHFCDSETVINKKIVVTKKMLEEEEIVLDAFPLSVFGVVKVIQEDVSEAEIESYRKNHPYADIYLAGSGNYISRIGFDFTEEQVNTIGKFSSGAYEGLGRRLISGATDSDGLFGGQANPEVDINNVLKEGQEQLFIELKKDSRKLKFRGDNPEAPADKTYPFKSDSTHDLTNNILKIRTDDLFEGDELAITMCIADKRYFRQTVLHEGKIFQDNGISIFGAQMELESNLFVHGYKIKEWDVPNDLPENPEDKDYKINYLDYISKDNLSKEDYEEKYDTLEGWRVTSAISNKIKYFWAADYRGILLVECDKKGNLNSNVIVPKEKIKNKSWFVEYVFSLDFNRTHENESGEVIIDEYRPIDVLNGERLPESMFDVSSLVNSACFDNEKIPYYKPFAEALNNISEYDGSDENGIGFPNLDIVFNNYVKPKWENNEGSLEELFEQALYTSYAKDYNLKYIDCSFSEFDWINSVPLKRYDCEEGYDIVHWHYNCHTYDMGDGPGIYFSTDYIENSFMEWRPEGGTINSFWKYETPYFCEDFTRNARIFIEDMGGNSLNTYSWIYVDTSPSVPETISFDNNDIINKSILSFYDSRNSDSIVYHSIDDGQYEIDLDNLNPDFTLNHNNKSGNSDLILSSMGILGASPAYSDGVPVLDDITQICYEKVEWPFFYSLNLLDEVYGLDFNDEKPTISFKHINSDIYIRKIHILFEMKSDVKKVDPSDSFISLHFKDNDTYIENLVLPYNYNGKNYNTINCKYYGGKEVELSGNFWDKINILKMGAVITTNDISLYKTNSSQISTIYDSMGRIIIFYNDESSGNISVLLTRNEGETWVRHKDIIRLLDDETASLPLAVKDNISGNIQLFYSYNDSFLMCRSIDINLFDEADIFSSYNPPSIYNANSDDDNNKNEESSLAEFSTKGKALRRTPSYFVYGDFSNELYQEQHQITNEILTKNQNQEGYQHPRFSFASEVDSSISDLYKGQAYSVFEDNQGVKRLLLIVEGKFTMLSSPDFIRWKKDIDSISIHKNFFTDEGNDIQIKNIEIVKTYYDKNDIILLYYYSNMLFMRRFDASLFLIDNENSKQNVEQYLNVSIANDSNPMFLMGKLREDILQKRIEELNNNVDISEIAFSFPTNYDSIEMLNLFNEDLLINSNVKPTGYITKRGDIRVFYKDFNNKLHGLDIRGNTAYPEVFFKLDNGDI